MNSSTTLITGREPRLSQTRTEQRGMQRLLPRRLGSLLARLAPGALSPDAAAAMLRSDDFYVRYNAARLLAERGDRDARLAMQKALETGDVPTRASVARQMFRFSWYVAEPLIQQALADEDDRVREGAIYALCDLRELSAYRLLAEALTDASDTLRAAAAWGLRNCQDSAAVSVLAAILQADDPDVRIKALEALSASDTREALPIVEHTLHHDPDAEVIYHAMLSWIELRGDDVLFDLADVLQNTSGERLAAMLRGVFHATNYLHVRPDQHPAADALLAALAHAITDDDPMARKAAIWPLAWMRVADAADILEQAFARETDSSVQVHLLRITNSLMSDAAPRLLALAQHSDDPMIAAIGARITASRAAGAFAAYDEEDIAAQPLNRAEIQGEVVRR